MTNGAPSALLLRRLSGVQLLLALGALFVAFPLVERLRSGELILSILMTFVLGSAVLAVAERRRTITIATCLALPALIGKWINYLYPELLSPTVFLVSGMALVLFVVANLLRFAIAARVVDTEVLFESLSAFLLLGLLWAFAYWLVVEIDPNAFSFNAAAETNRSMKGSNSLYFSLITLSTVGYGDITPVSSGVRMLAALEAMFGLLYVAVLIARLVALHSTTPKPYDSISA